MRRVWYTSRSQGEDHYLTESQANSAEIWLHYINRAAGARFGEQRATELAPALRRLAAAIATVERATSADAAEPFPVTPEPADG